MIKYSCNFLQGGITLYHPKWSNAKKHLQSFICDALRNRVDFHIINYRRAHDQLGRAVITVDKKEVLNMCTLKAEAQEYRKTWEIKRKLNFYDFNDIAQNRAIWEQAHNLTKLEDIYAQYDFFTSLEHYFRNSIETSLYSSDRLVKILALMDRRVGKRSLRKLKENMKTEPVLIQYLFQLRCEAEGIPLQD